MNYSTRWTTLTVIYPPCFFFFFSFCCGRGQGRQLTHLVTWCSKKSANVSSLMPFQWTTCDKRPSKVPLLHHNWYNMLKCNRQTTIVTSSIPFKEIKCYALQLIKWQNSHYSDLPAEKTDIIYTYIYCITLWNATGKKKFKRSAVDETIKCLRVSWTTGVALLHLAPAP